MIVIKYDRFVLKNGLRVLVHEDNSTPLVAVNVLYNVGARDESAEKTGFAHLFEHLMFGGSENIEDFDGHIQMAGGDSNAFTNNDMTSFYNTLPAPNIETAFWLESDRMKHLKLNQKALDIQRKVVVEEFKETCLNAPYGDVWHHLSDLAFTVHPYRWPTIGLIPKHVEDATLEDVQHFFQTYYRPNNAILSVAGPVKAKVIQQLAEKWFGDIAPGIIPERKIPQEPVQKKLQQRIQQANVPVDALYLAFHTPARTHPDYFIVDLLSDILCNGFSSRLYRRLLKEQLLVNNIDAYITGNIDPGLLIIEAKTAEGVSLDQAEQAIWKEIEILKQEKISKKELQKYVNKVESTLIFSETNILNKAMNLAYFELLEHVELINTEVEEYRKITPEDIHRVANEILTTENCSELYYQSVAQEDNDNQTIEK